MADGDPSEALWIAMKNDETLPIYRLLLENDHFPELGLDLLKDTPKKNQKCHKDPHRSYSIYSPNGVCPIQKVKKNIPKQRHR